ncbi:MAG: hypothetical protein ABSF33_09740 [Acidimicrobiales bacterium]|jgi:hypothetical protein
MPPLLDVSCVSSTYCSATGVDATIGPDSGNSFLFEFDGDSWSEDPNPDSGSELNGISCSAPGYCTAVGGADLLGPLVLATPPPTSGYVEVASDGGVFSFAPPGVPADFYGSMGGRHLNAPIVGITWDPHDGGYIEVASDGGVFSFAPPGVPADFYGSMGGRHLNAPIVGIAWAA